MENQVRPSEVMVVFHGLHETTQDNIQDNTQDVAENTQDNSG
jgi:hypothetical protein